ncbi:MAG TPA: O-antigen ligase family protein [Gaiellaceae bacterium]|nr:O-antigen ligase family protein [Gaiellaceae bacterium]
MEHPEAAQIAALAGALGALLVLLPRDRFSPLAGFVLLGGATGVLAWSLVGDDDLRLLVTEPSGLALLGAGSALVALGAAAFVRAPEAVPLALLAAAPFRVPVQLGSEEAFLLLPVYAVLAAAVLALAVRVVRGARPPAPPLALALPVAGLVALAAVSYLWTWDERAGGIALAFFFLPFTGVLAVVARAPLAAWLQRAALVTLVALGALFAGVGIWQAQSRTLFFARDVEVANAYTSFFRVTSLFKDPSLYGRYLVVPIVLLLVALLLRRGGTAEWLLAAAAIAFLFWGLFYSYSQSSFVALFVVTFALALLALGSRLRVLLLAGALVATLAAGAYAATAIEGRSARDVTSGRSRLVDVTLDAFRARPLAGVGVGGQPRASAERSGRGSPSRNASHTTPLTVLAELGVVGFALYAWTLGAAAWALWALARARTMLAVGLAAVLLTLVVHSLLYAGFFEDPLTWGVLGVAAAALAGGGGARAQSALSEPAPTEPPRALAH